MLRSVLAVLLLVAPAADAARTQKTKTVQQRVVKIQKTSLSRDQEIQLGKQAAGQVEQTMEVIHNATVEAWLNNIGQKLAKTPEANAYPYYFKLLNDESINAFALPGGPMYVHTGLISAAESESQVAGVLAHEMSHVALRHGAAQMSKAQTWQTVLGLAGAAAGMTGSGLATEAVQLGGGLGISSLLSKFSRDYERDADLNGARMMASAGYNPLDLATFFEKLEAQMGAASKPKGLEKWLSDHPAPGRRREYIEEDIQFYPKRSYTASTGQFDTVRRTVASLPPPKKKAAASLQPVSAQARTNLPQGFRDLQTQGFAIAYPGSWRPAQQGRSIYIIPQGGAVKGANGGIELIAGALIDYYEGGSPDLQKATVEYLDSLKKSDGNLRVESSTRTQVGGQAGMVSKVATMNSFQQDPNQVVYLYTVLRQEGLWSLALATPQSRAAEAEPIFRQIVETVQFRQ